MAREPKYYVRKDGRHEASRIIDGKRITFYGKDDREVEAKMRAYQEKAKVGRSFSVIAKEWEKQHFPTLAHSTLSGYVPALKRAIDHFGDESIKDIKAPDVKRFIADFSRGGRAQKTVANQLLITSQIFDYAATNGEVDYNPCTSITIPKGLQKTHREAATPEEEEKVKQSADIWLLPYFILYTGLRKGEVLALTYDDIDLDNDVIHVTKSVYFQGNQPYIKRPKTLSGVRTVPILAPLKEKLPEGSGLEYVFSPNEGKPMTKRQYVVRWNRWAKETGVTATAHQLRHSYATMLFELDIDAKIAQELLGHSTEAMTREIYTHLRKQKLDDTTALINKALTAKNERAGESIDKEKK